jgi:hypothetical protein
MGLRKSTFLGKPVGLLILLDHNVAGGTDAQTVLDEIDPLDQSPSRAQTVVKLAIACLGSWEIL